ncbi:MAG: oligoendopeptidase F [Lachnospiraceae bacterium]|nr:oligoendopeptidase F [Lachnospiraceae bacterium]
MKREEQKKENTWALEDLYINDDAWKSDGVRLQFAIDELKEYDGKLQDSAGKLLECLKAYADADCLLEAYYVYANERYHQDTANFYYQGFAGEAEIKMNLLQAAVSYMVPQILAIPKEKLDEFYSEEPELLEYRIFIENIQRQKEHTLDEKGEAMLAAANEVAKGASNIYSMFNNADVRFADIKDEKGETVPLTQGRFVTFMENQDRRVRQEAFTSLYATYKQNINTVAAMFDANARASAFFAKERLYDSALEAALDDSEIPVEVYHKLIETVHDNLDAMYDYVALRKKLLGVDELHMYDVYVPMVKGVEKKYTFEEAKALVLEGLAPLGEDYLKLLKEGFDNRWIDVYENEGKRTGAYSWGAYGVHPYVLLNFQGTLNHVFTLAHEMGHALHSHYSDANQPYLYAGYKIFVAEVASTCNEALLIHYLLEKTEDKKEKAYLINYFLEQFKGTLFRQTMFAEFEMMTHDMVKEGKTLTADVLCDTYRKLNEIYFGPDMVIDEEIAYEWARIPHFYTPFYVYQYATGFTAAIAISSRILKGEEGAVEDYKRFLSGGSSMSPIELLRLCKVDMTESRPVEEALNVFREYLNRMQET